MKSWVWDMAAAAGISSCIVVSLIVLEYVNTGGFASQGFPSALFAALWLMPFVLVLLVTPVVRNLRSGDGFTRNPFVSVLRTMLAIGIVVIWVNIVSDQAPCFMGVPNCD